LNPGAPVIVLSGLDRCGKTTMARSLSRDLNVPVFHFGVPPEEGAFQFYLSRFTECVAANPQGFIFDRSFLDNRAYNGVFGGGVLDEVEFESLALKLEKLQPIYILMYDGSQQAHKRIQAEGKSPLTFDQVRLIQERFVDIYKDLPQERRLIETLGMFSSDVRSEYVVPTYAYVVLTVSLWARKQKGEEGKL